MARIAAVNSLKSIGTQKAISVCKRAISDKSSDVRLALARRNARAGFAPLLKKLLEDRNAAVQYEAAVSLSNMDDPAGNTKLLTLAKGKTKTASKAVVSIIRGDFSRATKQAVLKQFLNKQDRAQSELARVLQYARIYRVEAPVERLSTLLEKVFFELSYALAEHRLSRSKEWLVANAASNNSRLREASFEVLLMLSAKYAGSTVRKIFNSSGSKRVMLQAIGRTRQVSYENLCYTSLGNKDTSIQQAALQAIEKLPPRPWKAERIAKLADDKSSSIQSIVARLLGRLPVAVSRKTLATMVKQKNCTAVISLGCVGKEQGRKVLRSLLYDNNNSLRVLVICSLGCLKDKQCVKSLRHMTEHEPDVRVYGAAYASLAYIEGGEKAVVALLCDSRPYVREAAVRLLRQLGHRRHSTALIDAMGDKNMYVSSQAEAALRKHLADAEVNRLLKQLNSKELSIRNKALGRLKDVDVSGIELIEQFLMNCRDTSERKRVLAILEFLCVKYRKVIRWQKIKHAWLIKNRRGKQKSDKASGKRTSTDGTTQSSLKKLEADYRLAKAYIVAGREDQAKVLLEKIVRRAPKSETATKARKLLKTMSNKTE